MSIDCVFQLAINCNIPSFMTHSTRYPISWRTGVWLIKTWDASLDCPIGKLYFAKIQISHFSCSPFVGLINQAKTPSHSQANKLYGNPRKVLKFTY